MMLLTLTLSKAFRNGLMMSKIKGEKESSLLFLLIKSTLKIEMSPKQMDKKWQKKMEFFSKKSVQRQETIFNNFSKKLHLYYLK